MDNPIPTTPSPVPTPVPPAKPVQSAAPVTAPLFTAPVATPTPTTAANAAALANVQAKPITAAPAQLKAPAITPIAAPAKPVAPALVTAPIQTPVAKIAQVQAPTIVIQPAAPAAALKPVITPAPAPTSVPASTPTTAAYKLGASAPTSPTQSVRSDVSQKPVMPIKRGIGKILLSLIIVAIIGGGAAGFYIAAPETFYNAVGQYVGMTRPVANEVGNKTTDATTTVTEPVKPVASTVLDLMPGADANVVVYYKKTDDLSNAIGDIQTALVNKLVNNDTTDLKDLEEKNSKLLNDVEEIAFATKFDLQTSGTTTGTSTTTDYDDLPLFLGFRVAETQTSELQKTLMEMPQFKNLDVKIQDKNFVFVSSTKGTLQGKLSDNPLFVKLNKGTNNLVATSPTLFFSPYFNYSPGTFEAVSKQLTVSQFAVLSGSVVKNADKYDFMFDMVVDMGDAGNASKIIADWQPQLDQLTKIFIPTNYQIFLTTALEQEENSVHLTASVKDLKSLATKLLEAQIEARKVEADKVRKFGESQTGTTTDLTLGTTTEPTGGTSTIKVPRKK